MSNSQDPTAFSLDELSSGAHESVLARRELLIESHIWLHNLDPGYCEVRFNVPRTSVLLEMAATTALPELAERVADSVLAAVSESINILVLGTGNIEKSGPIVAAQPPPVLELRVYLHSFRQQDAEVELAMPNPRLFQELTETGSTLESVMGSATGVIDRKVRKTLIVEASSGALFS